MAKQRIATVIVFIAVFLLPIDTTAQAQLPYRAGLKILAATVNEALGAGDAIVNRRLNRWCERYAKPRKYNLRHHRQRQIIPIAAFVVGLEGVVADCYRGAIP